MSEPTHDTKPFQKLRENPYFKTITLYVVISWIVLQVIAIIFPILDFTTLHQRWVLILLLTGLPITLILVWTFGSHSKVTKKRSRVIALVLSGSILFGGLFYGFEAVGMSMTYDVSITDEHGVKSKHQVFKPQFVKKIVVFPAENKTENERYDWLEIAFAIGLCNDLIQYPMIAASNGPKLNVIQDRSDHSRRLKAEFFTEANLHRDSIGFKLNVTVYRSRNLKKIKTFSIVGPDVVNLVDEVTLGIIEAIEIDPILYADVVDLPVRAYSSDNDSAIYYAIEQNSLKSLSFDSTFAFEAMSQAWRDHYYQISEERAKRYMDLAMKYKGKIPADQQPILLSMYYWINEDIESAFRVVENGLKLRPNNIPLVEWKASLANMAKKEQRIRGLGELARIRPLSIFETRNLALALAENQQLEDAEKVLSDGLETSPEGRDQFYYYLGYINQLAGEYDQAEKYYKEYKLGKPTDPFIDQIIGSLDFYKQTSASELKKLTERLEGSFRSYSSRRTVEITSYDSYLFQKGNNQGGAFRIYKNDSSLIHYWPNSIFYEQILKLTDSSKVYGFTITQISIGEEENDSVRSLMWKVDPLIDKGLEAIKNHDYEVAEVLLNQAYKSRPTHRFLQNYIDHARYMKDKSAEDFTYLTGTYEDRLIWIDNDQIRYAREPFPQRLLLPISDDWLKFHGVESFKLEILREDGEIVALQGWTLDPFTEEWYMEANDYTVRSDE